VSVGAQIITVSAGAILTMEAYASSKGTPFGSRTWSPQTPANGTKGAVSYIIAHKIGE